MSQYTSYYLYQKYEQRDGQAPIPVYPNVYSVDGDGTLPKMVKQNNDQNCGYIPFNGKFKATYFGGQTYSAECDVSSAITSGEVTTTDLVEVEIGDCVTTIGDNAFWNCRSLTSIEIPDSVTRIGDYAFKNCSNLTSVTVNATTPPTLGNNVFTDTNNCPIYVPCESVDAYKTATNWSTYASRIQSYNDCQSKAEITIDSGSTYSLYCDATSSITETEVYNLMSGHLPFGGYDMDIQINDCVTSIANYAFNGFGGTGSYDARYMNISIPNSVTTIGNYAFYCGDKAASYAYMDVTIGSGVTSIGDYAFRADASTNENDRGSATLLVTINATTPPTIGTNPFSVEGTTGYTTLIIYVPSTAVNTYKSASGWSSYASRIQAIP